MAYFQSVFREEPFTFLVGPEKTCFKIPPSLLAKHSPPLKAMISNGMKETNKKIASLPDEEPETLGHFLEWAFTGVYRVQEIASDKDGDIEPQKPGNLSHMSCGKCKQHTATLTRIRIHSSCTACGHGGGQCANPRCKHPTTIRTLFETACTHSSCSLLSAEPSKEATVVQVRNHFQTKVAAEEWPVGTYAHKAVQEFMDNPLTKVPITSNLVAHAKVYVFAEKYLIGALSQMALRLLHPELQEYSAEKHGSGSLVRLIKYTYKHTVSSVDGTNDVGKLKTLSLRHAALGSDKFLGCKAFCKLLRDEGEFGVDFAKTLSKLVV